jgi:hypothetical protein
MRLTTIFCVLQYLAVERQVGDDLLELRVLFTQLPTSRISGVPSFPKRFFQT